MNRLLALVAWLTMAGCAPSSPAAPGDAGSASDSAPTAPDDASATDSAAPADSSATGSIPTLAIPCTDVPSDVYITPAGLPPFDSTQRGAVVRCAPVGTATATDVAAKIAGDPGVTVTSGYRAVAIAYRTERHGTTPGVGTALLYLPDTPRGSPTPLVIAAHGTVGLADACAPSRSTIGEYLILPWVAGGFAVVAPDYAGMGNEGVQGYGDTADTAHSAIDAARAALRAASGLSSKLVVAGHSQGGGTSLGVQALAGTYGAPDLTLAAAVGFAPGYTHGDAAQALRAPSTSIADGTGVQRATMALFVYAAFANLFGEATAPEVFRPLLRNYVSNAIAAQCIAPLTVALATPSAVYLPPTTIGELVDPTFSAEVVGCLDGGACTTRAQTFITWSAENVVPLSPSGAPILITTGDQDPLQGPDKQACLVAWLAGSGVKPQTCVLAGVDHKTIVQSTSAFAIEWASARLSGATPPPCPTGPGLPACAQ
jgi:acetyl esterase/lipase